MPHIQPSESDPPSVPLLLTVKNTILHFGLSSSTIYRWLAAGQIESVHVGRSHYIVVASVHAALARLQQDRKPRN